MKLSMQIVLFLSFFALTRLCAQTQAANEAMRKSIELQQISIQQQVPNERVGEGFFQLSRPASMGATVAAPARAAEPIADCDPLPPDQVDALIDSASTRESLDRDLLRGVIRQESAFKPCAVSPKGAQGLMQLMPATAQQFGVGNAFDPVQNVDGGAKLLKQLLMRYNGDLSKALGAYNAGPAQVDAVDGIPQIPETQDYIKQILSLLPIKQ